MALHYFDQRRTQELFDEIYELLKPGGILVTLANTTDDPEISRGTKIEEDYYQFEGLNKRFFSVKSMQKFAHQFTPILLDAHGETHKDEIKTLIRFVGKK